MAGSLRIRKVKKPKVPRQWNNLMQLNYKIGLFWKGQLIANLLSYDLDEMTFSYQGGDAIATHRNVNFCVRKMT